MIHRSGVNRWRERTVHVVRVGLVVALLLAIPSPAQNSPRDTSVAPSIDALEISELGDVSRLAVDPLADGAGMWRIVDANDQIVAMLVRTLPSAKDVVGYRGPTESAVVLNPDLSIRSVTLLQSADTDEHVDAVNGDSSFFQQFVGWPWGGPPRGTRIDAVSGATLTSLALAEGVLQRIGGSRPSLVFPDPLEVREVQSWYPLAVSIDDANGIVRDRAGTLLGQVIRSGPLSDDVIGYQGPTELLINVSNAGRVEAIRLRSSFDNEPYVDYVRVEAGFWKIFTGKTLAELAVFQPQQEGVEGVSGATMTSLAVADTIVAATQKAVRRSETTDATGLPAWQTVRWTIADVATILMLLGAAVSSRFGLYRNRMVRRIWLLAVIVVVGAWSGNLVSMALIAGWSAEGIAWRLAPGLSAIAAVALLCPVLAKSNPYCNHLCPHGAVQQWIKPPQNSSRHRRLSRRVTSWLRMIPGATLIVAYLSLVAMPAIDLSSWEPFHAYLFRISGWGSVTLAVLSVALAAVIPMGYCRLGCPTGRLIDYVRRSAANGRIQWADGVATGLLLIAILS